MIYEQFRKEELKLCVKHKVQEIPNVSIAATS